MSQCDSQEKKRILKEEKWDRGRREAAGDGATSHPVKAFQFGGIGSAYERKPLG